MNLTLADLPTLNAALNATSAVLLLVGWVLILRRKIDAHRRAMLSAFGCSIVFLMTLSRALARRFDRHKRIARWTLPIWLYVSVTGVVVYWMLYQMRF